MEHPVKIVFVAPRDVRFVESLTQFEIEHLEPESQDVVEFLLGLGEFERVRAGPGLRVRQCLRGRWVVERRPRLAVVAWAAGGIGRCSHAVSGSR